MVTSDQISKLKAHEAGRGTRRYYKPDFYLPDQAFTIEVKPTYPSLQERRLCAAFADAHGPIILLYGGGVRGGARGFCYPSDDDRSFDDPGVPCVPHGLLYARQPGGTVTAEATYLGRARDGTWGFRPLVALDAVESADKDRMFLRQLHADAKAMRAP